MSSQDSRTRQVLGTRWDGRTIFAGAGVLWSLQPESVQPGAAAERDKGFGFLSELTFLLVLEELFQALLLQFLPSTTQTASCWSLAARPVV